MKRLVIILSAVAIPASYVGVFLAMGCGSPNVPSTSGGGAGGAGGGAGSAGGSAGTGGAGNSVTFSGTVDAPAGGDVAGTEVIACVVVSGECDGQLSRAVTISTSGASAPFSFGAPAGYSYLMMAMKDLNGSNTLDAGDYVAYLTDAAGSLEVLSSSTSGLHLSLTVNGASALPSGLVGSWVHSTLTLTSNSNARYTVAADGTYTYSSNFEWEGTCLTIWSITETSAGTVSVQGSTITFTPAGGLSTEVDCSDISKDKPVTSARVFTYSLGPGSAGGTSLFLDNGAVRTEYTRD
jgi:trimeric autotransporter adhesin